MFQLGKTIVSEEIIDNDFVCNLSACKGACCVEGDAGAPLDKEETEILQDIYPKVKPFLRKEGIEAIEAQGTFITTPFGDHETPLINGADCAYVIFDDNKIALCGIEEAYNQGEISWKKPLSCHLYGGICLAFWSTFRKDNAAYVLVIDEVVDLIRLCCRVTRKDIHHKQLPDLLLKRHGTIDTIYPFLLVFQIFKIH